MDRLILPTLAILALLYLAPVPGYPSVVIVPDDVASIQSGVDSGADTVLVRGGTYSESPVVTASVAILGIGPGRPQLEGLAFFNHGDPFISPRWSLSQLALTRQLQITTDYWHPRLARITISDCTLREGLSHLVAEDVFDIDTLTITGCIISGSCDAVAGMVRMVADTIDAGVRWYAEDTVDISDCWFRGSTGAAISVQEAHIVGSISDNRIEGYDIGIHLQSAVADHIVERNRIDRCERGIVLDCSTAQGGITVRQNWLNDCGIGITSIALLGSISENTILRCRDAGMMVEANYDPLVFSHNVVGGCGRGIVVRRSDKAVTVTNSTVFNNAGAGIAFEVDSRGYAHHNIGFANQGCGLVVGSPGSVGSWCNDWFGNEQGATCGAPASPADLDLDPLFCDIDNWDVGIQSTSPLVDADGCGLIGAVGVGCGTTATSPWLFTVEQVGKGVSIRWRLADHDDLLGESWVERASEDTGLWTRLEGRPQVEGGGLVQWDRDVQPGMAYLYRIGWWDDGSGVRHSLPIVVRVRGRKEEPTIAVFPNPTRGRVEFLWMGSGEITEVRIHDLAGRLVAVTRKDPFRTGERMAAWDGLLASGKMAPPGHYVVRVRGVGFEVSRRFLLLR